jgi:hypothetical protein
MEKEYGDYPLYRKITKFRNAVMHSAEPTKVLLELASKCSSETGEVLFRSVCYLLEFEDWKTVTYNEVFHSFPFRGELQCNLLGKPTQLDPDRDPYFEIEHKITESMINEDGGYTIRGSSSFKPFLHPSVKEISGEFRFYGDSKMKGQINSIALVSKDGKITPIK